MIDINIPPREFKLGDEVYCLLYGEGKVVMDDARHYPYPITVDFFIKQYFFCRHAFTKGGRLTVQTLNRSLFHKDEQVEVITCAPEYEYQVTYKRIGSTYWSMSGLYYTGINEWKEINGAGFDAELFLPSKRKVKND